MYFPFCYHIAYYLVCVGYKIPKDTKYKGMTRNIVLKTDVWVKRYFVPDIIYYRYFIKASFVFAALSAPFLKKSFIS